MRAADLLTLPRRELHRLLLGGHRIDPRALDDSAYRGVSLGLPRWVERLTWKTFQKTFHRDPQSGRLRGWNVRLIQTGLDGPIVPRQRRGRPFTFGHYEVVDDAKGPGLLLDYRRGGNPHFDLSALVVDPLVALHADDPTLLLGWSCVALGGLRLPSPSYFTLERLGPLIDLVAPPRRPR